MAQQRKKSASAAFNPSKVARERRVLPDEKKLRRSRPEPADTFPRFIGLNQWKIADVLGARNDLATGNFKLAVQLMRSVKTDPATYSAVLNRLAPQAGLPMAIEEGKPDGHAARSGGLGETAVEEAREQFLSDDGAFPPEVRVDANEALAAYGVAVCQNAWKPRKDGKRVDVVLETFPMEWVRYFEIGLDGGRGLYALTTDLQWEPIIHGNGQWVVFQASQLDPWMHGALLPSAQVWSDRAIAVRDRSRNATSHGDSKWIGTLPEGMKIQSPDGQAFLNELDALNNFQRSMIKPYGSQVERNESMAQNWQIFKEIIVRDDSDAAKIWLGQDGTVNNAGGNYIKSEVLFGVRNDIVEKDLSNLARGFNTGTVRPWQARNFGRTDLVKGIKWQLPDFDQDARIKSITERTDAFHRAIDSAKKNGFLVDEAYVNKLAELYDVPAPTLVVQTPVSATADEKDVQFGIITINERRAQLGLGPIAGGDVTVPQVAAQKNIATPTTIPAGSAPQVGGGPPEPAPVAN